MNELDTLGVQCPNCQAPATHRCTVPTDTGRKSVRWVHSARVDAAVKQMREHSSEYLVEFTDGGGEAQCEFYAARDTAEAIAKEREGALYEVRLIANYEVDRN